jgi:hypothetical protein
MKVTCIDGWARTRSTPASRRKAFIALALGGIALVKTEDMPAKKRKRKKKRTPPPACGPCETYDNGSCKMKPVGATCRFGATCLANGSCAETCLDSAACGAGCVCGGNVEGGGFCIGYPAPACSQLSTCSSNAECPRGHQCESLSCGGGATNRCVPLCIA